jgi:hypothetical protein
MRFCTAKPAKSGKFKATPTLALLVRLFMPGAVRVPLGLRAMV